MVNVIRLLVLPQLLLNDPHLKISFKSVGVIVPQDILPFFVNLREVFQGFQVLVPLLLAHGQIVQRVNGLDVEVAVLFFVLLVELIPCVEAFLVVLNLFQ